MIEVKQLFKTYGGKVQALRGVDLEIGSSLFGLIGPNGAGNPRLLIVDEPTSGLDPEERVRLRNLLSDMAAQRTVILSTHIVEDISQICNDLAVIAHGQVLFRGAPRDLIGRARGHVWTINSGGERPNAGLMVVSTLQLQDTVQYRVLGDAPGHTATPAEPSLEDGYMWLMRSVA